jgi:hypothetical protein
MLERKVLGPPLINSTPKLTASHYNRQAIPIIQAIPQLLAQALPVNRRTDGNRGWVRDSETIIERTTLVCWISCHLYIA